MYGLSKDNRSYTKEYEMTYLRADNIKQATELIDANPTFPLLHGGSDLALKIKSGSIEGIIDISHLKELEYIKKDGEILEIGALTSINTILNDKKVIQHFPLLTEACQSFASHQIRNIASLAGNIANDSPVADLIAPLLVLRAEVILVSIKGTRTLPIHELFQGFKQLNLNRELISSFKIPLLEHNYYYRKVGPRANLNISKVSLAMVHNRDGYFLSGASVNPFVMRFRHSEELLNSKVFSKDLLKNALAKDIAPSGSFRSTKEYRSSVLLNMILEALESFKE